MARATLPRVLHPRVEQEGAGSQSLTFGFAFMAILLFLLFFAHLMQRVANRRQREEWARMGALQDVRELEEVPKIWDLHISSARCAGNGDLDEKRSRWNDMQPLSVQTDGTDKQSSAGPHDRPLHVSMIISMPVSPTIGYRRDSGKCSNNELDFDGLACYEIGVMTVK